MASNPMQRKTRNSFILGMIFALLIGAAVIAFLFMKLQKADKENKNYKASMKMVYALNQDVNSGDVLTKNMFSPVEAIATSIPADYVEIDNLLSGYSLYTKKGDSIWSKFEKVEKNGRIETIQHLFITIDNKDFEVLKDNQTGEYYYMNNKDKVIVETSTAPVIVKIGAKSKTIISPSMVARTYDICTDDIRKQEYNVIILPIDLVSKDYVDVRLMLPNGQDFIVLSKKMVTIPQAGTEYITDTVQMNLSEDEILTMSCAIVDAAKIKDAKLYATKYVEAGLQEAADPTYLVNNDVANLIERNTNIVAEAMSVLKQRYSSNLKELRGKYIDTALVESNQDGNEEDGYSSALEGSITSTKDARQKYIQGLTATTSSETGNQ